MVNATPAERRLIGDPVMTARDRLDFFLIGEPSRSFQPFHLFAVRGDRTCGLTEPILSLEGALWAAVGGDLGPSLAASAPMCSDRPEQRVNFVALGQAPVSR